MTRYHNAKARAGGARAMVLMVLALVPALPGCAVKKPTAFASAPPSAQLAIPVDCIDRILHGTKKSMCVPIPGHPDWAECGHVVVHYTCTKVVAKAKVSKEEK